MEAWPSTLPQAPHIDFSWQQSSGLLDAEEKLYPVRTRTYSEYAQQFSFKQLTVAQFKAFRAWWDVTLNQCAPFTAPWLAAAGCSHHFCRFDAEQPWEATLNGYGFDLVINVEVIATMPTENGQNAWYMPEVVAPVAQFAANVISGWAPLTVIFTADISAGGEPDDYAWSFGDGSTSTDVTPTHTYAASGAYTVSLTVSNGRGSDTEVKVGYINPISLVPPNIDFSGSPVSGVAPLMVYFTSITGDVPVASYAWSFGDGSTSTAANPSHKFTSGDPYWSSVVLLIQPPYNAEDGSTVITDRSESGRVVSRYGDAQVDTSLGYQVIQLDGSGDYCTVADDDVFDFTGVATLEIIFRTSSLSKNTQILAAKAQKSGLNLGWWLSVNGAGSVIPNTIQFTGGKGIGAPSVNFWAPEGSIAANTTYHVEIARAIDLTYRMYLNGVLVAISHGADVAFPGPNSEPLHIGRASTTYAGYNPAYDFTGIIRGVRWTDGIARHSTSESFTPPVDFLPNATYTVSLTAYNSAGSDTETKTAYITTS